MRGRLLAVVLVLALLLGGCTTPWLVAPDEEGLIRIVVSPSSVQALTLHSMAIPSDATSVRIRVWHPDTGFDAVRTIDLGGTNTAVDIPVPEDTGYIVDAVSYYMKHNRALALTGGRTYEVAVSAKETTNVQVELFPWTTATTGDETIDPDTSYTVEVLPSDAGGLLTLETFRSATLHSSTTDFQDADDALPLYPNTAGIPFDDRIVFSSLSPDVSEITTLYICALVEFVPNWCDPALNDRSEQTLYIEMPNRHMGEPLHQVTVDPTAGGIVVEISAIP